MAPEAAARKSVTAEQLAAQVAKLNAVETVEKSSLPTAEDIATDGDAQAAAEAALQQGKEALKTAETEEKNKLPTVDDINAERSATLEAAEILAEGKRKLSAAATVEKNVLPSAADIKAEKDDKACDVASDQMAKAAASRAAAAKKGSGLGTVKNTMAFGAGAGGGFGLNAPGFGKPVQSFSGTGEKKKQITVNQEIVDTWQNVLDDEADVTWIYCKYSADKKLDLAAKGTGGLSEFKAQIGEEMAWGGFLCHGVDKRGGTEVRRKKLVFVQVRPEGLSMVKKGKQASHQADVKAAIVGTHLDIAVETVADLDEQALIKKLQAATGAHKPNGYEFDPGKFLEADFYGLGIGKDCKGETAKSA